jgi:hypothetical protein
MDKEKAQCVCMHVYIYANTHTHIQQNIIHIIMEYMKYIIESYSAINGWNPVIYDNMCGPEGHRNKPSTEKNTWAHSYVESKN